jgi:hypothetical protein
MIKLWRKWSKPNGPLRGTLTKQRQQHALPSGGNVCIVFKEQQRSSVWLQCGWGREFKARVVREEGEDVIETGETESDRDC